MEISFRTNKLEKAFQNERKLKAAFGAPQARFIRNRVQALMAAENLGVFLPPYSKPERCHELSGDRDGQISLDLQQPYRLILEPNHDPKPQNSDGGLDWLRVTAVRIIAVENTHE